MIHSKSRLFCCAILFAGLLAGSLQAADREKNALPKRLNVLFITADDLNYDSLGVTGCRVDDITPNLDRLASQGMLFTRAHVTIAVCQPCRGVLMTGLYPHHNGALGFQPIRGDVPTLQDSLQAAGYFKGILAKVSHLAPIGKFRWDVIVQPAQLGTGRSADLYYRHSKDFFDQAKKKNKPFFLMANAQDPHRPFAGSDQEKGRRGGKAKKQNRYPKATRYYKPEQVEVPGFLPDLPLVRQEIAEYYTSVHRCDEVVGAVLKALDDSGLAGETLVMFISDHGMALPFAKTNCYRHSTRTPWIVRWPGYVKPGSVDNEHFISGIDFMPTILQAASLPPVEGLDGRSFLPLLMGKKQSERDKVFTHFHRTAGKRDYPMRSVIEGRFGYIVNAWSDGKMVFHNESQSGRTMRAMRSAAKTDKKIAARVELFEHRVPEELYDYQNDPDALVNLIDDPRYRSRVEQLRQTMLVHMRSTDDPILATFEKQLGR